MSERGLPIADGAQACPFVAFADDRDERATEPDHRHRCYADVRPAPRALAHQAAYCLSSAFPVCPTFQDWARREAARARDAAASAAAEVARTVAATASPTSASTVDHEAAVESVPPPAAAPGAGAAAAPAMSLADASSIAPDPGGAGETDAPPDDRGPSEEPADDEGHDGDGPRRNPPREWSAPPPWLASAEAARAKPMEPPDFLAGRSDPARGLAGSAADLLAGGSPPRPGPSFYQPSPADIPSPADDEPDFEARDLPRPATPPRAAATPRRPRAYDQHLGGPVTGPDWERPKRYEAYPTIRTRMGLPTIPRLAGMAAAVALAAVALFFLPALLGLGANDQPSASPSSSASPSKSIAPTPTPAPTPEVYIIKKGDTLSKIAVAHGLTIEQLMAANPTIKDPNKIIVGQQIIIPPPPSAVPDEFGGSGSPSASASP